MLTTHTRRSGFAVLWLALSTVLLNGCSAPQLRSREVTLEDPSGVTLWQIEPGEDGLDLEDAASRTVAQFRLNEERRIVFDHSGQSCAAELMPTGPPEVRVSCAGPEPTVVSLRREPDGDYRLETQGQLVAKFKVRDYGYKVEAADGSERKLRVKPDKMQLRDGSDRELFSTKSPMSPLAAACFAVESVPIEVRAALCIAVEQWGLGSR